MQPLSGSISCASEKYTAGLVGDLGLEKRSRKRTRGDTNAQNNDSLHNTTLHCNTNTPVPCRGCCHRTSNPRSRPLLSGGCPMSHPPPDPTRSKPGSLKDPQGFPTTHQPTWLDPRGIHWGGPGARKSSAQWLYRSRPLAVGYLSAGLGRFGEVGNKDEQGVLLHRDEQLGLDKGSEGIAEKDADILERSSHSE